jgi:hypothetical protein
MDSNQHYEKVELRTGINPTFLAETLTTDIELVDALYDMIDNSIDAARNIIVAKEGYKKDGYGLPSDYSGYKITLRLSPNRIVIVDNSLGIDSETVENKTFYTGDRSNHKYGIGHYGLGLKRALLKAGERFSFMTDNGLNQYKSEFTHTQLSDSEETLYGKRYNSKGIKKTVFICTDLKQDAIDQLKSKEWFDSAFIELCLRYSEFIKKGLNIQVDYRSLNYSITKFAYPRLPFFRSSFPFKPKEGSHSTKASGGKVVSHYSVGIHESYRFPCEYENTGQKHNATYTQWYGIYILCNDRVIVAHSFEKKHGFNASFHSEYNGCVCIVRINSEDPALLPWNTAKTEVKARSELFLEVRAEIESFTSWYRSKAKEIINAWNATKGNDASTEERKNQVYLYMGWPALPIEAQLLDPEEQPIKQEPQATEDTGVGEPQMNMFSAPNEEDAPTINPLPEEALCNIDINKPDKQDLVTSSKPDKRIPASSTVIQKLVELDSKKISSLYNSLLSINLSTHPVMMYVGAWSFIETLCSLLSHELGNKYNGDFQAFMSKDRLSRWGIDKSHGASIRAALRDISEIGNASKHDPVFYSKNAEQLAISFKTLEPILLALIEDIIKNMNTENDGS